MFHTLQIDFKNSINELSRVNAEMSSTISQKQLLKEANVRLTAQLNAVVEDSNVSSDIKFFAVNIDNVSNNLCFFFYLLFILRLCRVLFQNIRIV